MPTVSYAFAVGNVRAKEAALLKKQDIEQLLSLDNQTAAATYLRDKGFGKSDTDNAGLLLKEEEQNLWEYIRSVAPDFSVFSALIIEKDYHNIKAVLKGTVVGVNYKKLLISPSLIDTQIIEKAVIEQDFSLLPPFLRDTVRSAWEALVKTGDPQLCDAVLDASCMEQKLKMAAQCPPMLRDIVETTVFYDNIKGAIRCARAGKTPDFCEKCIVDTPAASKKELKNSVLKGVDGVLKLLHGVSVYKGYLAVEAYKISPSEFEKFVDNLVLSKVSAAKYIAVGAEPLVAYLIAKLTEIKVCRIAVNGIATAEDQNKTREMLRELYG